jgi:heme-degrading monooxygenase HmoA
MHARASTIQASREKLGELERILESYVLSELEQSDGYSGIVGLSDPTTGKCLVISFWETDQAMRASDERASRLRTDAAQRLGATDDATVERYEVVLQEVRTPVHA